MKNATLHCALLLSLQTFTPAATAMTQQEAANNIMHIAFAIKEGEFCERLGFPGDALLKKWKEAHGDTLVASLRQVEAHAAAGQTVTKEQAKDVAIGFYNRMETRFDAEIAPVLGKKSCSKLGESLRSHASSLVKN